MDALKLALPGLCISNELEPSHALLDRACAMYDANVVRYLEPASCVSRASRFKGLQRLKNYAWNLARLLCGTRTISCWPPQIVRSSSTMQWSEEGLRFNSHGLRVMPSTISGNLFCLRHFIDLRHQAIALQVCN